MTRVLIVESAGQLWGSEKALLDLIDAVPSLQIAVCCPPGTPLVSELRRRHVVVFELFVDDLHKKSRVQRVRAALGVLRACLAFRPEVIHLNQSGAYRVCLPAARLLGCKLVSHVRIFEDAAYLAGCKPSPHRLKAIIAISGAIEEEIRRHPSLEAIEVHRIYDAYAFAKAGPVAERNARRIACVGRVAPIKGQEVLIEAVALAGVIPRDIECLIVGEGQAEYVARLKNMRIEQVKWTGYVADVPSLLRTCALLVCPSHREPLGRVIFEAWDAGAIPVVFAGAGGAAEVVAASNGGILYYEQTPRCLAEALGNSLALAPSEAAHLVANGRAWLQSNCAPGPYGLAVANVLTRA